MTNSVPDPCAATKLRALFEQLLDALDHAGFSVAGAHADLARHAFEDELTDRTRSVAEGIGMLLPDEVPKWRAARVADEADAAGAVEQIKR